MSTAMDEEQRLFLVEDWRAFLVDLETDAEAFGRFTPETAHFLDHGRKLIAWLEGGPSPGEDTREFLEGRLAAYDETHGYDRIVLGHDALAAAIKDLR